MLFWRTSWSHHDRSANEASSEGWQILSHSREENYKTEECKVYNKMPVCQHQLSNSGGWIYPPSNWRCAAQGELLLQFSAKTREMYLSYTIISRNMTNHSNGMVFIGREACMEPRTVGHPCTTWRTCNTM